MHNICLPPGKSQDSQSARGQLLHHPMHGGFIQLSLIGRRPHDAFATASGDERAREGKVLPVGKHRVERQPQTTVPPFATLRSACGRSWPAGAKMIAASSVSGGAEVESPAQTAPSDFAKSCAAVSPGRVKANTSRP